MQRSIKNEIKEQLEGVRPKDLNAKGKSSKVKSLMIDDLRKHTATLEKSLFDKDVRIQTLLIDLRELRKEVNSLTSKLERRDDKIESIPSLVNEKTAHIKQAKSESLKLSYRREINKIARLETAHRREVNTLNKKIDSLNGKILELRKRHVYKNKRYYDQGKSVKEHKAKIRELRKEITKFKAQVKILTKRISSRDVRIRSLYDRLRYKPKPPKPKVVRIKEDLTPYEKELKRIAESGMDKRNFSMYEFNLRTLEFLCRTGLDFNRLNLLMYVSSNTQTFKRDISSFTDSNRNLHRLLKEGLISATMLKNNSRYYYITENGKELLKDYSNYISFGKSPLEKFKN